MASLTFIVAVLNTTNHLVFGLAVTAGGVVSVILLLRVRKLHKMAERRRK